MQLRQVSQALGNLGHMDAQMVAADGAKIAYRTSETAGTPERILVYMNGTAGKADLFDGMGEKLAEKGIKSVAITARDGNEARPLEAALRRHGDVDGVTGFRRHAADFDQVFEQVRREHPNTPIAAAGDSFGAEVVMQWNATRNATGAPVLAAAPVVLDKFQPIGDKLKVVAGLVSKRAAQSEVATPMKLGRKMSDNPASQYNTRDMSGMTVPAEIFDDVLKMNVSTLANRGSTSGHVTVVKAGSDEVALNAATRPFTRLSIPSDKRTVTTVPGGQHDLSQESHRPDVVDLFARHAFSAS